eukprot:scaffold6497_cov63-Skeletonema_menzelii.AAC.1
MKINQKIRQHYMLLWYHSHFLRKVVVKKHWHSLNIEEVCGNLFYAIRWQAILHFDLVNSSNAAGSTG